MFKVKFNDKHIQFLCFVFLISFFILISINWIYSYFISSATAYAIVSMGVTYRLFTNSKICRVQKTSTPKLYYSLCTVIMIILSIPLILMFYQRISQ